MAVEFGPCRRSRRMVAHLAVRGWHIIVADSRESSPRLLSDLGEQRQVFFIKSHH